MIVMTNNEIFKRSREACKTLAMLSDAQRNEVLQAVADAIMAQQATLLQANTLTWQSWILPIPSTTVCN